jgi:hypothetical protein
LGTRDLRGEMVLRHCLRRMSGFLENAMEYWVGVDEKMEKRAR